MFGFKKKPKKKKETIIEYRVHKVKDQNKFIVLKTTNGKDEKIFINNLCKSRGEAAEFINKLMNAPMDIYCRGDYEEEPILTKIDKRELK